MQGSGYEYVVWKLGTNAQPITIATSGDVIRDRLYWRQAQTIQLKRALNRFGRAEVYGQVNPMIADILAARDLRFAWEAYSFQPGDEGFAAVWICSPSLKKMAYLHSF